MPHFSIEYSANVAAAADIGTLCEVVRKAAVETGIFPLGGIRVRAIRCDHYAIADGLPDAGFVDILLRIGEGRSLEEPHVEDWIVRTQLSDHEGHDGGQRAAG